MTRPHNPASLRSRVLLVLLRAPTTGSLVSEATGCSQQAALSTLNCLRLKGFAEGDGNEQRGPGQVGRPPMRYKLTHAGRALAYRLTGGAMQSRRSTVIRDEVAAETLRRAQDAGRARHPNAGMTEAIRKLLGEEDGLLMPEIAERLGKDLETVRRAVHQMTRFGAGAYAKGPRDARRYYLFERAAVGVRPRAEGSSRFAGPVTIGRGSRWFADSI